MNNSHEDLLTLRFKLSCMCKYNYDDTQVNNELNDLATIHTHNIKLKELAISFPSDFTGFEYALGLDKSTDYLSKIKILRDSGFYCVSCNCFFMSWLADVKKVLTEINKNKIKNGDIVLYYERLNIKKMKLRHAGIVIDGETISSKWGTSNVYEHGLLEIPEEYGDKFLFFQKPEHKIIENCFNDYMQELASKLKNL